MKICIEYMEHDSKKKSALKKKERTREPEPEPEKPVSEDDLSEELENAGEDFGEYEEEEEGEMDFFDFPQINFGELFAQHFEHEGRNIAEILSGIQGSVDANSKCLLKLAKEVNKLAEQKK